VKARSPQEIAKELLTLPSGSKMRVLARIVTHRKGEHRELFADLKLSVVRVGGMVAVGG
jgi:excinuclease ABC subunit A